MNTTPIFVPDTTLPILNEKKQEESSIAAIMRNLHSALQELKEANTLGMLVTPKECSQIESLVFEIRVEAFNLKVSTK